MHPAAGSRVRAPLVRGVAGGLGVAAARPCRPGPGRPTGSGHRDAPPAGPAAVTGREPESRQTQLPSQIHPRLGVLGTYWRT
jgi:hypothetical protein